MADPAGEADRRALKHDFDRWLMLQFRGSVITSNSDPPLRRDKHILYPGAVSSHKGSHIPLEGPSTLVKNSLVKNYRHFELGHCPAAGDCRSPGWDK